MSEEFKSFYKEAEVGRCHYPTRLDTYGCGCQHNCSYCYARSLLAFRKLWNPKDPKVVDISKVERVIKKIAKEGNPKVVRLGGMTDCFQPCEKEKRAMVADDEYMAIMDKSLAHIQVTVTTLDDAKSREYEKASDPTERIKAILKLQDAGFDIDYSKYTLKAGGYMHLPLEAKKEILSKIKIPDISVCEDVPEHYEHWKENVNPNKEDCCNLRRIENEDN